MRPVPDTAEFRRIRDIPRRQLQDPRDNIPHHRFFRSGWNGEHTLRKVQQQALLDLREHVAKGGLGLLCPIGVGGGKSLVCCLAGEAVAWAGRTVRTVVWLVPASLRAQASLQAFTAIRDWQLDYVIQVVSYEQLSSAKHADILERLRPDVICCDEAHKLRGKSARTTRFRRYLRDRCKHADANPTEPPPVVLFLSGTITSRSLHDFAWMLHYTHAANNGAHCPIPRSWPVLQDWNAALGVANPAIGYMPMAPGVLQQLAAPGETARQGYRRRLVETLGVVATQESACDMALNIRTVGPKDMPLPPAVASALADLQANGPGQFETDADQARYAKQLALGYRLRFADNGPPREWFDARANWFVELRSILRKQQRGLDSPLLVANAIARGDITATYYADWCAMRDRYGALRESMPEWLHMFAVDASMTHAKAEGGAGIVWYSGIAFGDKLREHGMRVFGAGDDAALAAEATKPRGWIACSIQAHGTGKNLQAYDNALIVSPPSSGTVWEQLLGRHHRPGQQADEVNVTVWQYTAEQRAALEQARKDAEYLQDLQGAQKLNLATWS